MKLAVQENLVPGDRFAEKVACAEDLGFEGIEVWGNTITQRVAEVRAALRGRRLKVSTICDGIPGALVTTDPELRRACRDGIMERLRAAADLGAVGLIVVPAFNREMNLPDLSPFRTSHQLGEALLVAQLREMAPDIEKLGGPCILVEPLNRYEAAFLCKVARAIEIVRQIDSPAVRIMCDLYHMNMEEPDIPAVLRSAGGLCAHIHLADNTRMEPGSGSTDFKAALAALKETGFAGYMALECGLTGDPRMALNKAVQHLRSRM